MPIDCITGAVPVATGPYGTYETYNQAGRLASVSRGGEVSYYGYTAQGQIAFEGRPRTDTSLCSGIDVTYYVYDYNGNTISILYPAADPNNSSMARQINYL